MDKILVPKGSYEVLHWIGEGSHAIVYLATKRDEKNRSVANFALKIFKQKEVMDLLRNEFSAMKCVNSPHCVRCFGWEAFAKGYALVLEHIDGMSLRSLLHRAELTEEKINQISAMIASGLRDLHKEGLVHGDLTPNNVLIEHTGRVVLVDYGQVGVNPKGRVLGLFTPAYSAPEVLAGEPPTAASDWYSLGMIRKELAAMALTPLSQKFFDEQKILLGTDVNARQSGDLLNTENVRKSAELAADVAELKSVLSKDTLNLGSNRSAYSEAKRYPGLIALIAVVIGLSGSAAAVKKIYGTTQTARVTLRTLKWCRPSIDGNTMGDFPIESRVVSAGKHVFACIDSKGQKKELERNLPSGRNEIIVFWSELGAPRGGQYATGLTKRSRADRSGAAQEKSVTSAN